MWLPLTDTGADTLIPWVKAVPLLLGYRGSPPADLEALRDLLLRVSRLADDLPRSPISTSTSYEHAYAAHVGTPPKACATRQASALLNAAGSSCGKSGTLQGR